LKALGRPETSLPSSIVLESLLALFLGITGACLKAPALKEITWASEMKTRCAKHQSCCFALPGDSCSGVDFRTIDEMDARMGFANFVTRGRVLGQDEKPSTTSS
jgi:hypothetical protein